MLSTCQYEDNYYDIYGFVPSFQLEGGRHSENEKCDRHNYL